MPAFEVRVPRLEVGAHRVAPAADLVPGVRRHVVDVAGAGNEAAEELGARLGLAGDHGRLGGVHVEVAGAGVLDVLGEHAFEHLVQPLHVRVVDVARAAARLEQEQRVGVERHRIEVVGILLGHLAHRLGVGLVLLACASWRSKSFDVAHRHRLDEAPAPSARRLRAGPAPSASRRRRTANARAASARSGTTPRPTPRPSSRWRNWDRASTLRGTSAPRRAWRRNTSSGSPGRRTPGLRSWSRRSCG